MTLQDRIDELVAQHGSLRAVARVTEIDAGYLSRLRAYANVNPGRDKLRRLGLRRVVVWRIHRLAGNGRLRRGVGRHSVPGWRNAQKNRRGPGLASLTAPAKGVKWPRRAYDPPALGGGGT